MTRANARPFLSAAEFFAIVLFAAIGFSLVAIPAAYGNIASAVPAAPAQQSTALQEAEASCQMIRTAGRASECHVMDWNPSLDVIVPVDRPGAVEFCDQAAESISENFKQLAGKTWKVRVFSSGLVPPTAVCRVR